MLVINNALRIASRCGNLPLVEFLVSKGADIHNGNNIALIWASYYGHLDIVKFLADKGANIHTYKLGKNSNISVKTYILYRRFISMFD